VSTWNVHLGARKYLLQSINCATTTAVVGVVIVIVIVIVIAIAIAIFADGIRIIIIQLIIVDGKQLKSTPAGLVIGD
jgi:hypothetical protein